jgi:PAS domain S-box-containing protein
LTDRVRLEERLLALHDHTQKLAAATNMNEIVAHTLRAMEFALGFEVADFSIVDTGRQVLRLVGPRGKEPSFSELALNGPGITVKAARLRKTIRTPDVRKEAGYVDEGGRTGEKASPIYLSELSAPVVVDGEAVAVLNVGSSRLAAFTVTDERLLETLAGHVSMSFSRLRRDEALRKSEENMRTIFNATTDAVALFGIYGTVLAANEVFARMVHRRPQETIGSCAYDLVPRDLAERRKAIVDEIIRSGKAIRFEDEQNGVWFDNSVYPVLDAQGRVAGLAAFEKDTTERKRMEEALRESEALLNETGDIAKVGGWEHNLVTRKATWTKSLCQIVEIESGPPPGPDEHLNYYPPHDRAILTEA